MSERGCCTGSSSKRVSSLLASPAAAESAAVGERSGWAMGERGERKGGEAWRKGDLGGRVCAAGLTAETSSSAGAMVTRTALSAFAPNGRWGSTPMPFAPNGRAMSVDTTAAIALDSTAALPPEAWCEK